MGQLPILFFFRNKHIYRGEEKRYKFYFKCEYIYIYIYTLIKKGKQITCFNCCAYASSFKKEKQITRFFFTIVVDDGLFNTRDVIHLTWINFEISILSFVEIQRELQVPLNNNNNQKKKPNHYYLTFLFIFLRKKLETTISYLQIAILLIS